MKGIIPYTLCSRCGSIFQTGNIRAKKCDCSSEHYVPVYLVQQEDVRNRKKVGRNNVYRCPCCGHERISGIVRTINLGKDEATAILGQTLYTSLDSDNEGQAVSRQPKKISFNKKKQNVNSPAAEVKQFLTFSDSRQQASFFAAFMDGRHRKNLQRRLIWELIQSRNYENINFGYALDWLEKTIKERSLFEDELDSSKHAWVTLLTDLLHVDGYYDGEALGIFYFELDLDSILEMIDEDDFEEAFGRFNLKKSDLRPLLNIVFRVFKDSSAIYYLGSQLSNEEKQEYLAYRRFDNFVTFHSGQGSRKTRSFVPVMSFGTNANLEYMKKVCNCDKNTASEVLELLFQSIGVDGGLFRKHETENSYQIPAEKYVLRNYKKTQYYRCNRCGRMTPYNVHDVCPMMECDGRLEPCDPDAVMKNNYYRKMYMTSNIEKLTIREHTAQLKRKTAKEYQEEFKRKNINVLSCSTTFEMGVDIGDLETVFMRNVPPTPANYVQRAGRAGRRLDSSAFIMTYCGSSSHDYTFFSEPEKMISGVISPPFFDVTNEKIILRQLTAAAMGFFFRTHPQYFRDVETLVIEDGLDAFEIYVNSRPSELKKYIDEKILTSDIRDQYSDFKWMDLLDQRQVFSHLKARVLGEIKAYNAAIIQAQKEDKPSDYYLRQVKAIKEGRVIDLLSSNGIIPKYGFPVDVVDLKVYQNGRINTTLDLSRDLKIAISEYAPDSEIIVDKKKYTSKYITLPKDHDLTRYYYCQCGDEKHEGCGRINISTTEYGMDKCRYCGRPLEGNKKNFFVIPELGFKTGETKESSIIKPKKTYTGQVSYIGGGKENDDIVAIGDVISAVSSSEDQLMIMNRKAFFVCPVCGYGEVAESIVPKKTRKHKNYRGFNCDCNSLQRWHLGHIFKTDVVKLSIPSLTAYDVEDYNRALSFLYALLEGISEGFNIERTDIDGLIQKNNTENAYDVLIFDNVPGGAGYIKRIMSQKAILQALHYAYNKVSQDCCDPDTSCYHCLRNYYNQAYHPRLKRKYALQVLENIFRGIEITSF